MFKVKYRAYTDIPAVNLRGSHIEIPLGDVHGYGQYNEPFSISAAITAAISSTAAGVTAAGAAVGIGVSAGVATGIATVGLALTAVSAVTSIAGAITGDKTLNQIGKWTGLAGGVIGGVAAIGNLATSAGLIGTEGINQATTNAVGESAKQATSSAASEATKSAAEQAVSNVSDQAANTIANNSTSAINNAITPNMQSAASNVANNSVSSAAQFNNSAGSAIDAITPKFASQLTSAAPQTATSPGLLSRLSDSSNYSFSGLKSLGGDTMDSLQSSISNSITPQSLNNINSSQIPTTFQQSINSGITPELSNIPTQNFFNQTGAATDKKGILGELFQGAIDNPGLTKTLLETGAAGISALKDDPNAKLQEEYLRSQQAATEAQKRALARKLRWQKGLPDNLVFN